MVQDLIARLERDQTGYEHQDPIWETRLEAATMLGVLVTERDEADRRAGAAERRLEYNRDTLIRADHWRREQKARRGYNDNISFDVVWAETCAKADSVEEFRKALQHAQWCRVCAEGTWSDCPEGARALKLLNQETTT